MNRLWILGAVVAVCVIILVAYFLLRKKKSSGGCDPACKSDEVCFLGVCQPKSNIPTNVLQEITKIRYIATPLYNIATAINNPKFPSGYAQCASEYAAYQKAALNAALKAFSEFQAAIIASDQVIWKSGGTPIQTTATAFLSASKTAQAYMWNNLGANFRLNCPMGNDLMSGINTFVTTAGQLVAEANNLAALIQQVKTKS